LTVPFRRIATRYEKTDYSFSAMIYFAASLIALRSTRARIEQSSREHHAMIEALSDRDVARLNEIIALHIPQPQQP
jgi:DNA-binding GntR family transcriptional regulator